MKRTIGMFLVCILSLTACGTKNDDNLNLTANAVVTEVQEDTITVKDAEESMFSAMSALWNVTEYL